MRSLAHHILAAFSTAGAVVCLLCTGDASGATYAQQHIWTGEFTADQFGIAVTAAGDVNGDGWADLLIGANVNDHDVQSGGRAYLFLGGPEVPATWTVAWSGQVVRGYGGGAVAGGEDLNGDGFDDWVVGAPGPGPAGDYPGQVFVFFGGPTPDAIPDLIITGTAPGGQFGQALALLHDLDGDGDADLAVGAPRDGDGRVAIYRGGATALDTLPDAVLHAGALDERFGRVLARLPDRDGDGRDELLIGVPLSSRAHPWAGAVLMLAGTADLDTLADKVWTGETAGEELGYALAVGDVDDDGVADLLTGSPFANTAGGTDAGRADLFLDLAPAAAYSLAGEAPEEHFGLAVSTAFDWNGDGADDLAVGAPEATAAAGLNAGRVAVLLGGADFDTVADTLLTGSYAGLHLGTTVVPGGDVSGNLRGSLCLGGYNSVNSGSVWLLASGEASVVGVQNPSPTAAALSAPWPNPANPSVSARLSLSQAGRWRLDVVDLRGRRVRRLLDRELPAGDVVVRWDGLMSGGGPAPSGAYRLRAGGGNGAVIGRGFLLVR